MTIDDFLKTLKKTEWRIKKGNQWYELRVAESVGDLPFVDQDGELFGVKNAKINFYVFKAGSDEIADWIQGHLKKLYDWGKWNELPEDEIYVHWGDTYAEFFIQDLLNYEEFLVLSQGGNKQEKWYSDPNVVY